MTCGLFAVMKRDEKLVETIAFRVTATMHEQLQIIAKAERRKMSEVELALLERGLAAYGRDSKLFEDEPEGVIAARQRIETKNGVKGQSKSLHGRGDSKQRRAG